MARNITFNIAGNIAGRTLAVAPVKLERKKLYGWSELRVVDKDGNVCRQSGINNDGCTIVDNGCTKVAILDEHDCWTERDALVALNPDGTQAEKRPSVFSGEIALDTIASVDDLMDIKVASVYQIAGEDAAELLQHVGDRIYTFPFSYTGGYEQLSAFLLAADNTLYIIAGTRSEFEYLTLDQAGVLDTDDDCEALDEEELDFTMM